MLPAWGDSTRQTGDRRSTSPGILIGDHRPCRRAISSTLASISVRPVGRALPLRRRAMLATSLSSTDWISWSTSPSQGLELHATRAVLVADAGGVIGSATLSAVRTADAGQEISQASAPRMVAAGPGVTSNPDQLLTTARPQGCGELGLLHAT